MGSCGIFIFNCVSAFLSYTDRVGNHLAGVIWDTGRSLQHMGMEFVTGKCGKGRNEGSGFCVSGRIESTSNFFCNSKQPVRRLQYSMDPRDVNRRDAIFERVVVTADLGHVAGVDMSCQNIHGGPRRQQLHFPPCGMLSNMVSSS